MSEAVEKADLRTDPMRTREGLGLAARRWAESASRLADAALLPVIEPGARRVALETVQSLAGFWVMWQLEGGFDGMKRLGYSEATIYRKVKAFRESFKAHPDDFQFPGITIDVEAYLRAQGVDADDPRNTFPKVVSGARSGPYSERRTRD